MQNITTALMGLALLLSGSVAWAGQTRTDQVDELKMAQKKVARQLFTRGSDRVQLQREQGRINRLIEDLEAGRPVDPSEIDRALEHVE
jgi:hypothetical protein